MTHRPFIPATDSVTGADNELLARLVELTEFAPREHPGWWLDVVLVMRRIFLAVDFPLPNADHAPFAAGLQVRRVLTALRDTGIDEGFLVRAVLAELDLAVETLAHTADADDAARWWSFAERWRAERDRLLSDDVVLEWRQRRGDRWRRR